MSQPQSETPAKPESSVATVQTGPVDISRDLASDVKRILDEQERNEGAFRPVYTLFHRDIEVRLVEQVPAVEAHCDHGHVVITRPEWDEPRNALPQNVEVRVEEDFE